jgi:hypothetical protein
MTTTSIDSDPHTSVLLSPDARRAPYPAPKTVMTLTEMVRIKRRMAGEIGFVGVIAERGFLATLEV